MDFVEIIRTMYEALTVGNDNVLTAEVFSIISAILAATAAAVGAGMAAKEQNDARRTAEKNRAEIEKEQRIHENLYNKRRHQDMTDTTEAQAMMRELREQKEAQESQNDAQNTTLGVTNSQKLAEQNSLNKSMAEGMAGISRNASAMKDAVDRDYEGTLANYFQNRREANMLTSQAHQNQSNMWGTMASNAMGAAAGALGSAIDNGGVKANTTTGAPKKAPAVPQSPTTITERVAPNITVKKDPIEIWRGQEYTWTPYVGYAPMRGY